MLLGLLCRGGVAWIGARRVCGTFLPLAALFAFNLWLSNMAYIHLSVALIRMIKAITPCVVMAFAFLMGLDAPSWKLTRIIFTISLGVLISTATDAGIATSGVLLGVVCQTIAIVAEALRLNNLAKVALSSQDVSLDPISMLVYMCPLTFVLLLAAWIITEYQALVDSRFEAVYRVGWPVLLSNSSVAFLLNMASMALVAKTSALTQGLFAHLVVGRRFACGSPPGAVPWIRVLDDGHRDVHAAQARAGRSVSSG